MSLNNNQTSDLVETCSCFDGKRRPQEITSIETPVILDQLQMRESVTRNIALFPRADNDRPSFKFKGTGDFRIVDLQVLTKMPAKTKSDEKKVNLLITISYNLIYTDGLSELVQPDEACFELWIDKIKCPDRSFRQFKRNNTGNYSSVNSIEKTHFTAEAIAQTFGEVICSNTGALIIDLGVFFIIKSICIMQLLVPSAVDCPPCYEQRETCDFKAEEKRIYY